MSVKDRVTTLVAASIFLGGFAVAAQAADIKFKVKNDSSSNFSEITARVNGTRKWSNNQIAKGELEPLQTLSVILKAAKKTCLIDLKAVYADGELLFKMRYDVCKYPKISLH